MSIKDQAAIVGIGQTEFRKGSGRSELDMACEAIKKASEDAGISVRDIDGMVRYDADPTFEPDIWYALGIPHMSWWSETSSGGGGLASVITHAATAIAAGMAKNIAVYRACSWTKPHDPAAGGGIRSGWATVLPPMRDLGQFQYPFGVSTPVQEIAMIARRHMHLYGTKAEHFGQQAVNQREFALNNPNAIFYGRPLTLEDWRNSRMVADPLHLPDCCMECDGGVAVIVTAADRARDLKQRPVYVMAAVQGEHPIHRTLADYFAHAAHYGEHDTGGWSMGPRLFGMAGIEPKDVSAAMIFDHFTPAIPLTLESFGFCELGEGGPFIESGETRLDGRLPVNTHGGSNGEAFIHGFNHIPEAVRQLRGEALNQVKDCEIVFMNGSITDPSGAVLLRR